MLPQGKIGIGLQMPGQPLSQGLALHRGPAGDLVYVDVPRKAPSLVPALDGRTRDPKELCNLLSWDAAVYCGEHFQSEVPRIQRVAMRSEERRVGKECRSRWSP